MDGNRWWAAYNLIPLGPNRNKKPGAIIEIGAYNRVAGNVQNAERQCIAAHPNSVTACSLMSL
jgi:hypothetical protein